jgi:hypothetical protein
VLSKSAARKSCSVVRAEPLLRGNKNTLGANQAGLPSTSHKNGNGRGLGLSAANVGPYVGGPDRPSALFTAGRMSADKIDTPSSWFQQASRRASETISVCLRNNPETCRPSRGSDHTRPADHLNGDFGHARELNMEASMR